MAILVNIGQRGFVLKEGLIAPGQQVTVDQETAEKLSRVYPQELKLVAQDKKVIEEIIKPAEEVKLEGPKVETTEVEVKEQKSTRRGKRKSK